MIKVLQITEEGRGGGALFRITKVAKYCKAKIDTVVLCPDSAHQFKAALEKEKIEYLPIGLTVLTKKYFMTFRYVLFFIPEIFKIYKIIKLINPDIVHANSSSQIKGIISARIAGVPSIWHMNDTYQPFPIRFLFKLLSKFPYAYIFASVRTNEYYNEVSNKIKFKKKYLIPAPVDVDEITPFRKYSGEGGPKGLLIGYINKHKGLELLIEAAKMLEDLSINIDVVGPVIDTKKPYKESLDELIESKKVDNVNFLGFQKVSSELFRNYDFYVCSSIREASPTSVWEALAAGLPIISTDVSNVFEVIHLFKCGIKIPEFTGDAIAEAIRSFMSMNTTDRFQMAENARRAAEELFSIQSIANSYIRLYSEIVSETTDQGMSDKCKFPS